MPKAMEHLESPAPWGGGRGVAEGLGEEEDGYKCPSTVSLDAALVFLQQGNSWLFTE